MQRDDWKVALVLGTLAAAPFLAAGCPGSASRRLGRGQLAAARTQVAVLRAAVVRYSADNGGPPTTVQGLDALLAPPAGLGASGSWRGPYLPDNGEVPLDPWGNRYVYESPSPNGQAFAVRSLGRDGRDGGAGEDADIEATGGPEANRL